MDRIGSGVRVSASFQIFALRILLHSAGITCKLPVGIFSGGNFLGESADGLYLLASVFTINNPNFKQLIVSRLSDALINGLE